MDQEPCLLTVSPGVIIRDEGITMATIIPPRHIVWSTDRLDLDDPFQHRWYLRQVIMHGRSDDIRDLNFEEIEQELDTLDLPSDLYQLWKKFLEARDA